MTKLIRCNDGWGCTACDDDASIPDILASNISYPELMTILSEQKAIVQDLTNYSSDPLGLYAIKFYAGILPRRIRLCKLFNCTLTEDDYRTLKSMYAPYGREVEICTVR